MNLPTHQDACRETVRMYVQDYSPTLCEDFDRIFELLYNQAVDSDFPTQAPTMADFGRGALDPGTLKDLGITSLFVIATYKLLFPVLGKSAAETLQLSKFEENSVEHLQSSRDKLIRQFPKAKKHLELSCHFCERFLHNLLARMRGDDEKRR